MDAEQLLKDFWVWRERGRRYQTLRKDLELFLTLYQPRAGWQVCSEVFRRAMAYEKWDIAQGGLAPTSPWWYELPPPPPLPPKQKSSPFRKGGLDGKGGLIAR